MIRFATDTDEDARGVFIREMSRMEATMKAFGICLSLAVASWVSSALMLIYYSREVAEFLVGRMP